MKKPIPLILACLVAWLGIGSFIYKNQCCDCGRTDLLIKDAATTVVSMEGNILCNYAATDTEIPNNVMVGLTKLVTYLNAHPNKTLTLIGDYSKEEKNTTTFENLGFGRAKNLKTALIDMGAQPNQIALQSNLSDNLSFSDNKSVGCIDYAFSPRTISISDNARLNLATADNLVFASSGFKHNAPLASDLDIVFANTATYLQEHSDRVLKITGLYGKDENNTSVYPNLGLARANDVKAMLMALGVSAKQLDTEGKLSDKIAAGSEILSNVVTYSFEGASEVTAAKNMKNQAIVLHFETNQDKIDLNEEQRLFFANATTYLDQNPKANVTITGHTDNAGNRGYNVQLGKNRADFVKNYLAQQGLHDNQMATQSKGPDQPLVPNTTPEGKAQNRRVEILIN